MHVCNNRFKVMDWVSSKSSETEEVPALMSSHDTPPKVNTLKVFSSFAPLHYKLLTLHMEITTAQ